MAHPPTHHTQPPPPPQQPKIIGDAAPHDTVSFFTFLHCFPPSQPLPPPHPPAACGLHAWVRITGKIKVLQAKDGSKAGQSCSGKPVNKKKPKQLLPFTSRPVVTYFMLQGKKIIIRGVASSKDTLTKHLSKVRREVLPPSHYLTGCLSANTRAGQGQQLINVQRPDLCT